MGIVRREGDWRLEKHDDGVYEVTHKDQPELKIITSDYEPTGFMNERNDFSIPVREVNSFSDAEQVFEQKAQGSPSIGGFNMTTPNLGQSENTELPDLPPGGISLVGIIGGGILLQQAPLTIESPLFIIGVGLLLIPVAVLGLAYRVYQIEGTGAALKYLIAVEKEDTHPREEKADSSPEKTSPAPDSMKDEIYFERADQQCEWCEERTDSPEVHHIEPRVEGGPNNYENLIALCPGCHSKADKGGISRTKLQSKVSRQMENWSKEMTQRS